MSEQHTPGKLGCADTEIEAEINEELVLIAEAYVDAGPHHPRLPAEANAARLVACWNACESLQEPEVAIPALVAALQGIADYFEDDDDYPDRLLPDLIVAALAALALAQERQR